MKLDEALKMWNPNQLALLREAGIAGNSLSAGLTSLRKANYAAHGVYSHAFFSLSTGLERTLKLIYLMDYAIENERFPSDQELRQVGHNIDALFKHAVAIKDRRSLTTGGHRVLDNSIELAIIKFMSRFATKTRYYNLNLIAGATSRLSTIDPINDWFESVGKPVLEKHLTPQSEAKVRRNAEIVSKSISGIAIVHHTAENGTALEDVFAASYQTGITDVIRKYGTFYAARLCRYIYYIIWGMRHKCHENNVNVPYLDELFFPFMNNDAYLLSRKTFPPRGQ